MQGYDSSSYGDAFADVYDDWYADVTDVAATVAFVADLAGPGGRVLELGVGTGRLALPMAAAGLEVVGVDSSAAMLARLREHSGANAVTTVHGDMVSDLPDGPFDVALVAYNTLFNLPEAAIQEACFREVAARLRPGGRFVVEAFVPGTTVVAGSHVGVRTLTVDRVVLSVSRHAPDDQRAAGQFVELTEAGGVRLRPWSIRWSTPEQLDEMASLAGLTLEQRRADMAGSSFDEDDRQHVSVYVR